MSYHEAELNFNKSLENFKIEINKKLNERCEDLITQIRDQIRELININRQAVKDWEDRKLL